MHDPSRVHIEVSSSDIKISPGLKYFLFSLFKTYLQKCYHIYNIAQNSKKSTYIYKIVVEEKKSEGFTQILSLIYINRSINIILINYN